SLLTESDPCDVTALALCYWIWKTPLGLLVIWLNRLSLPAKRNGKGMFRMWCIPVAASFTIIILSFLMPCLTQNFLSPIFLWMICCSILNLIPIYLLPPLPCEPDSFHHGSPAQLWQRCQQGY